MRTLTVNHFSFQYPHSKQAELSQIDWQPQVNSFNLLVGPSGSGKSTLLQAMAGLTPHTNGIKTSGSILLDDYPVATLAPFERAKHIGLLFQNPNRQFAMQTPAEEITFTLENLQVPAELIPQQVEMSLTQAGILNLANHKLMTLSGGEKQKVALAAILAMDSPYILLDEPFANIDPLARQELLRLLKNIQMNQHKTIIITDHDLSGYQQLVDYIYQLDPSTHTLHSVDKTHLNTLSGPKPSTWFKNKSVQSLSPLALKQLNLSIADRELIKAASFNFPKGQLGLLSGANGSGKSSLFGAITHQIKYTGQVYWHQQDSQKIKLKHWAQDVGLVFQDATDQFVTLTVAEELALSKKHSLIPEYWTQARIDQGLKQLELSDFQFANLYQLSGGQQKKIQVFCMLLIGQPFLLFDEPLAGLDANSLQQVLALIQQTLLDNNLSGLMISHQRAGLEKYIDYEIRLENQALKREA